MTVKDKRKRKRIRKETPEHRSWRGMIERCTNPKHIGFKYYGARGIKVCKRWRKFSQFLADIGPKPTPKHTIDRYPDKDGDYKPTNCRWATQSEQRKNQRPYDESARVLKAWETRSRVSKNRLNLVGERYGRFIVLSYTGFDQKTGRGIWLCRCDCGTKKNITGHALRNGGTKSCGCLNREQARKRAIIRNKKDNPVKYRWGSPD